MAVEPSAQSLIEQGLRLRRDGHPEEALELFQKAHALAPSARTFGQMGLVEASLQRWVDGETHLSVSLANPDDPWVVKNRAFLDAALSECQRHVGDLTVTGPAGAEVSAAGKLLGTLPAVPTLRFAEGAVTIVATAAGFQSWEKTVVIRAGARTALSIAMTPIVPAVPKPASAPPPDGLTATSPTVSSAISRPAASGTAGRGWHGWGGITLAAVGAAAAGWGIYWIAIDGDPACSPPEKGCTIVHNTRTAGWILAAAGAASIAGGAAIFFTGHGPNDSGMAIGLAPETVFLQARF